MTDNEITRLCAEAIGLVWDEDAVSTNGGHSVTFRTGTNANRWTYKPLTDDAQAMALAKHFMMEVDFFAGAASIKKQGESGWGYIAFSDESINRAIVECVAKMQAEKQPRYVNGGSNG